MNRRRFLQRAGTGTFALGSLPLLAGKAWADLDGDDRGFHFVVASFGPAGTDRLILQGDGTFDDESVNGGGQFDHFQTVGAPPLPIISTGTWKARKFVSFTLPAVTPPTNPQATHGVFQAGILVLMADFHPLGHPAVRDVQLQVVCNLAPAGASTPGKDEGVYLNFDGVSFQPGGLGVTIFTHNGQ